MTAMSRRGLQASVQARRVEERMQGQARRELVGPLVLSGHAASFTPY